MYAGLEVLHFDWFTRNLVTEARASDARLPVKHASQYGRDTLRFFAVLPNTRCAIQILQKEPRNDWRSARYETASVSDPRKAAAKQRQTLLCQLRRVHRTGYLHS